MSSDFVQGGVTPIPVAGGGPSVTDPQPKNPTNYVNAATVEYVAAHSGGGGEVVTLDVGTDISTAYQLTKAYTEVNLTPQFGPSFGGVILPPAAAGTFLTIARPTDYGGQMTIYAQEGSLIRVGINADAGTDAATMLMPPMSVMSFFAVSGSIWYPVPAGWIGTAASQLIMGAFGIIGYSLSSAIGLDLQAGAEYPLTIGGSQINFYKTNAFGPENRPKLTNVGDPTDQHDVATKGYVDDHAGGGAGAVSYIRQIPPVTVSVGNNVDTPTGIVIPLADFGRVTINVFQSGSSGTDYSNFIGMVSSEGNALLLAGNAGGTGSYGPSLSGTVVGSDVHVSISSPAIPDISATIVAQVAETEIVSGTIPADPWTTVRFSSSDNTTPHQIMSLTIPNNTHALVEMTISASNVDDPSDFCILKGLTFSLWSDSSGVLTTGGGTRISALTLGGMNALTENQYAWFQPASSFCLNHLFSSSGANTPMASNPFANVFTLTFYGIDQTLFGGSYPSTATRNWKFKYQVTTDLT